MSSIYCIDLTNLVRIPVHTSTTEITITECLNWLRQYGIEDYIYEIWFNGKCKSRWRHRGNKRWVRMSRPSNNNSTKE